MKRLTFSLLLLSFFLFSGSVAYAKKYVIGIDESYPPFSYIAANGKAAGFDVESMIWVANRMGIEIEHMPFKWSEIVDALNTKKIDMICSGITITDERKRVMSFSEPYFEVERHIVTKRNSKFTIESFLASDARVGVQRGTTFHKLLKGRIDDENLQLDMRLYDTVDSSIEDLLNGTIDGLAMGDLPLNDAILNGKPLKSIGTYFKTNSYGVAVRKEDTDLLNKINEGYRYLKADPFWKDLHAKYLNTF